jgi:hypothetical protein
VREYTVESVRIEYGRANTVGSVRIQRENAVGSVCMCVMFVCVVCVLLSGGRATRHRPYPERMTRAK